MSEWRRIDEIADVRRGASPRPIGDPKYFGGQVGWVRISDVTRSSRFLRVTEQYVSPLGESLSVRVNPGDLIMSICGTLGRPIIIDIPACIHDGFVQFSNLRDANVTFLFYALQHAEQAFYGMGQPGTQTNLNTSLVGRYKIFVPKKEVQRRIAEILSTLDEAIEQTEALIAKHQQIKAGMMHDLFTRGVTPDGKLRPPREQAPELYKETPIGWIPKEWGVVTVNECGSVKLGRQRSPDQFSGKWTNPYLRVANVFDGFIDYSDVLEMDFTPNERRTFSVKQGDILINEGQSLELVGRCSVFDGPDEVFCFQNTLVRFRCFDNNCALFYRFLFKWYLDCGLFMRIAKQTTSVAHLGADRFARMRCISVPYKEQLRIAERLGGLQKQLNAEADHENKFRQLKHGLMHDLLSGRVPVMVNDAEIHSEST